MVDNQDSLALSRGARALLASGKARIKSCDFTQALEDLSQALDQDPSLADARFMRAQVMENRDVAYALREYTALVDSDPARTEAYLARAALRRVQGDMIGAMADYQALESMVRLAACFAHQAHDLIASALPIVICRVTALDRTPQVTILRC